MFRFLNFIFSFCLVATAMLARADEFGYVKVARGRELWVNYTEAADGAPTLVFLNGLTYSTPSWVYFHNALGHHGYGTLLYDMRGQGRTLEKYSPVRYEIPLEDQVEDLHRLLEVLKIKGRVHLLGLSYGGGVALAYATKYPRRVENVILMAPFTRAVPSQDNWIKLQISTLRLTQPWNTATDDELYDFFLRQLVYTTYPAAEPVIMNDPHRLEATFRLVKGIRKFDALDVIEKLPRGSVHLITAHNDQYLPINELDRLWDALPKSVKLTRLNIERSEHKIPESVPEYAAAWVRLILDKDKRLDGGQVFEGDPRRFTAVSPRYKIRLPQE